MEEIFFMIDLVDPKLASENGLMLVKFVTHIWLIPNRHHFFSHIHRSFVYCSHPHSGPAIHTTGSIPGELVANEVPAFLHGHGAFLLKLKCYEYKKPGSSPSSCLSFRSSGRQALDGYKRPRSSFSGPYHSTSTQIYTPDTTILSSYTSQTYLSRIHPAYWQHSPALHLQTPSTYAGISPQNPRGASRAHSC